MEKVALTIREDNVIEGEISRSGLFDVGKDHISTSCFLDGPVRIETRCGGNFSGKAFYLDTDSVDWTLGKDSMGQTILVPQVTAT